MIIFAIVITTISDSIMVMTIDNLSHQVWFRGRILRRFGKLVAAHQAQNLVGL